MKLGYRIVPLITAASFITPSLALAHPGHGPAAGLLPGFTHPFLGLDHFLAMVMVGILAYHLGGRAKWLLPATFLAIMAIGGALGIAGVHVPFVELAIALSVIVLGLVVAVGTRAPIGALVALVGFFAVFHGHAHGTEMPLSASAVGYGSGFVLATATLHLVGLGVGYLIGKVGEGHRPLVVRFAGGMVAVAGIGILVGLA